ncbi:hypothetical protein [Dactylosporangium sp. CA-139066]|uniref:hypothetical protein n=1 Tax=Dactylosporangium sp. CA-139066 TaxID=3239930 RepID=UPI003D9494F8
MSIYSAIRVLGERWPDVVRRLTADQRLRLRELLADAQAGPSLRLAMFLNDVLPEEHPVRAALLQDDTTLGAGVLMSPEQRSAWIDEILRGLDDDRNERLEHVDVEARSRIRRTLTTVPRDRVLDLGIDPKAPYVIDLDGDYPEFQFASGAVAETVRRVNILLTADLDPWGAADWWISRNAWIGETPLELLRTGRDDDVVALAAAVGEEG